MAWEEQVRRNVSKKDKSRDSAKATKPATHYTLNVVRQRWTLPTAQKREADRADIPAALGHLFGSLCKLMSKALESLRAEKIRVKTTGWLRET